jgi:hypothetical protein
LGRIARREPRLFAPWQLDYEDCNDATTLRRDPVLKTCCGRDPFSSALGKRTGRCERDLHLDHLQAYRWLQQKRSVSMHH